MSLHVSRFFTQPFAPGPAKDTDYCVSNMGDATKLMASNGDKVQVYW